VAMATNPSLAERALEVPLVVLLLQCQLKIQFKEDMKRLNLALNFEVCWSFYARNVSI